MIYDFCTIWPSKNWTLTSLQNDHASNLLRFQQTPLQSRLASSRRFDFDINTCWKAQFIERFNCFSGRLNNVNDTLVSSDLELLTRFFVHKRTGDHRIPLNASWQGDWPMNF